MAGAAGRRPAVVEVAKQFVSRPEYSRAVGAGTSVGRRQVHVTGDDVAEPLERDSAQYLGHGVGELVFSRDWEDLDGPVVCVLAQKVMADVDMLCPLHGGSILGDLDAGAVVLVDHAWLLYVDAHGAQQHVDPDELLDCHAEGQVLRVAGAGRHAG